MASAAADTPYPGPPLPAKKRLGTVEGLQHAFLDIVPAMGNLVVRVGCTARRRVPPAALRLALRALQLRHPMLQYYAARDGRHVAVCHAPDTELRVEATAETALATETAGAGEAPALDLDALAEAAQHRLAHSDFRAGPLLAVAWLSLPMGASAAESAGEGAGPDKDAPAHAAASNAVLVVAAAHAICDARSVLRLGLELVHLLGFATAMAPAADGSTPSWSAAHALLTRAGLPPLPFPQLLAERMHPRARGVGGFFSSLNVAAKFGKLMSSIKRRHFHFVPEPPADPSVLLKEETADDSTRRRRRRTAAPKRDRSKCLNQWTRRTFDAVTLREACRANSVTVHNLLSVCLSLAFVEHLVDAGRVDPATLRSLLMSATVDLRPRQEPPCDVTELVYVVGSSGTELPLREGEGVAAMQTSVEALWQAAGRAQQVLQQQIAEHKPWKLVRAMNLVPIYSIVGKMESTVEDGMVPVLANAGVVSDVETPSSGVIQPKSLYYYLVATTAIMSVAATTYNGEANVVFSTGASFISATTMNTIADRTAAHVLRAIGAAKAEQAVEGGAVVVAV